MFLMHEITHNDLFLWETIFQDINNIKLLVQPPLHKSSHEVQEQENHYHFSPCLDKEREQEQVFSLRQFVSPGVLLWVLLQTPQQFRSRGYFLSNYPNCLCLLHSESHCKMVSEYAEWILSDETRLHDVYQENVWCR